MTDRSSVLRVDVEPSQDVPILTLEGVLDSSTYRTVRDSVINAAVDARRAVIVDINGVHTPSLSAWAVFTSARWHVSVWPDVPIMLVCAQPGVRQAIATAGITRYMPVYSARKLALDEAHRQSLKVRQRVRTELSRSRGSIGLARRVVTDRLSSWDIGEVIAVAATVATVFVENALDHTGGAPVLIVESSQDTVAIAVEDNSSILPGRHEAAEHGAHVVSGLAIVSAVCRRWGAAPTSSGKTVWALVGRENQL